jgi:GLPGLI family protein
MKRTAFTIALLTICLSSIAQSSGTIFYTETMKMNLREEENAENDPIMAMIPKERKMEKVLYFTQEASLYINKKGNEKETEKEYEEGNRTVIVKMDVPDEKFYLDIPAQTLTQQREFIDRKFLVEGKTSASSWKLTGNQKQILNYPCQEATMMDGDKKVTAWFTPAIPVGVGPHKFNALPGAILRVELDNGMFVMEANKVDLSQVAKAEIRKPKEGKKMTKEEYQAMVTEKMKEMGADGNGNIQIRVRR